MRKAFSLPEMLVVIAIIVSLAAISYPALLGAKQSAGRTKCLSNLKQIHVSLMTYRVEWDGDGQYGDSRQMGLPDTPAGICPSELFACGGLDFDGGPGGYDVMWSPDRNDGRSPRWSDYAKSLYDGVILMVDDNHDLSPDGRFSPLKTHRVAGLYLDGHVQTIVKRGDIRSLDFYHELK